MNDLKMNIKTQTTMDKNTECLTIWVTPEFKKEVEGLGDNQRLKEQIIRDRFTSEKNWLAEQMQEIDETALKYSAKLLTIKDKFREAHEKYVDGIIEISEATFEKEKEILKVTQTATKRIETMTDNIAELQKKIKDTDVYTIERMVGLIEDISNMTGEKKQWLKTLLNSK